MDTKLYVGNLSYSTSEDDLRNLFSGAGTVVSVALIKDRDTGRSKGFGFVEMGSQSEAENAIKQFNGATFGERVLKVNIARPMEERPSGRYNNNRSGQKSGYGDRNRRGGSGGQRRY
jgi:RNA recognition motif-containing protein